MGSLTFTYQHSERADADAPSPYRHVERWRVAVDLDGEPVGDASVIILNLEPGRDVRDLADTATGEWRAFTAALALEAPTDHLLVLERVRVEPQHRGRGFGPTIAAAVIERLGRGCRMAACFPAPFEGPCRPEDHDVEVEALGRIWAKVGFRHWRGGVWMLDLSGAWMCAA